MKKSARPQVAIIMGSQSDEPIMAEAAKVLKDFEIQYEMRVVSAHRSPEYMQEYALEAKSKGIQVIVAGAGGAAHLPGMVASLTTLPVIGVPVALKSLKGLDSLLSISQMPKGVPVATMAIDNAHNAGLLAIRILALSDAKLSERLEKNRKQTARKIRSTTALGKGKAL